MNIAYFVRKKLNLAQRIFLLKYITKWKPKFLVLSCLMFSNPGGRVTITDSVI